MKLIKKISLRNQCCLVVSFLYLLTFILYIGYIFSIRTTSFYLHHSVFAHLIYWIIMFPITTLSSVYLIDLIIDPIKSFIGYLKEFQNIDFKEVEKTLQNSDYIKLCSAINTLQQELFKTINELQIKNNEILVLNENQQKDFEYKKNLITSISHDIKTPLTIIHATISGIRDNIFPKEDINKELDNILLEVEKTTKMLQDSLSLFNATSNNHIVNEEEFQLIEVITSTTDNLKKLFEKHEHKLFLNLPFDITIKGDKHKFSSALSNLFINAIIYSPQNSEIKVNLINSNKTSILEIINTNTTINDNELKHLFDPFYQGDKSRNKKDNIGNGLGLYIAKEILNKHHLDLNVVNLDNAVKFYIIFK